jgi:hypothetical protein
MGQSSGLSARAASCSALSRINPAIYRGGLGGMHSGKPFKRFLLVLGLFIPLDESRG